ncbi:MAG: hypothetical protein RLZZ156_1977 [Deinococcota bacterium]|jgi:hypothetical protein
MARDSQLVFLFPSDYFNPKQPDQTFAAQVQAFIQHGFRIAVVSLETNRILPALQTTDIVVYRGWMLNVTQYQQMIKMIKKFGATPLTSLENYLTTHYLPNWYSKLLEFTPETRVFAITDNLQLELERLGWDGFFIKDYVKSLKTSIGSVIRQPSEITLLLEEMQHFRANIEGGICVRRLEALRPETEQRYFIYQHQAFTADPNQKIPDIVQRCVERIKQPFFSVDTIENTADDLRIVEIGDGQVSDLVGWSAERFAEIW